MSSRRGGRACDARTNPRGRRRARWKSTREGVETSPGRRSGGQGRWKARNRHVAELSDASNCDVDPARVEFCASHSHPRLSRTCSGTTLERTEGAGNVLAPPSLSCMPALNFVLSLHRWKHSASPSRGSKTSSPFGKHGTLHEATGRASTSSCTRVKLACGQVQDQDDAKHRMDAKLPNHARGKPIRIHFFPSREGRRLFLPPATHKR